MIKYSMYQAHDSVFHRLDPRVKFIMSLYIFVSGVLFSNWMFLVASFSFVVFLLVGFGRVRLRTIGVYLRPIVPLVVIMLLLWPLFLGEGRVLVQVWRITITSGGVLMGIAMAARILTMISATFLLLMTTQQKDIISGLTQMGLPYDYGLTLVIALRYVPTLAGMAQTITDAQRSRGLELDRGSLFERIRKYIPILAPLIVGAIRMAQELAIAIDSRAFGHGPRTYLYKRSMRGADYAILAVATAAFCVLTYARVTGYTVGFP